MSDWSMDDIYHWAKLCDQEARALGLTPRELDIEVVTRSRLVEYQSYYVPVRYPHWSFGKQFDRTSLIQDLTGFGAVELAMNSDPALIFLLDANDLVTQIVVMAHAIAHSDFFANNRLFAGTNPQAAFRRFSQHRHRIEEFYDRFSERKVERTLNAAHAIRYQRPLTGGQDQEWLLRFIAKRSEILTRWQREALLMVDWETDYFIPQIETKVMNEGWASYWQKKIVERLPLDAGQSAAAHMVHAGIRRVPDWEKGEPYNPYWVGFDTFSDIEERWDRMAQGHVRADEAWDGLSGREKLFQVRSLYRDKRFFEHFLTPALMDRLELWRYGPATKGVQQLIVTDTAPEGSPDNIKKEMMRDIGMGVFPSITVLETNGNNRGEWVFRHQFDGRDLDDEYTRLTLESLFYLVGRPVILITASRRNWHTYIYRFDGKTHTGRRVQVEIPPF